MINLTKYNIVIKINNLLNIYSNKYINIVFDNTLNIPALSFIKDTYPFIVINVDLFPLSESVIAHILAHEYGHHVLHHVDTPSNLLTQSEIDICEDQADIYASKFIYQYGFMKNPITNYLNNDTHRKYLLNAY